MSRSEKLITFQPPRGGPKTTIPVRLELEYMRDQRRLMRDVAWLTVAGLSKFNERQDSEELLAWLGMSAPQVLNERKLRRRLRQIANEITQQKLNELSTLLGRRIYSPGRGGVDAWIERQVTAVQTSIENWLVAAGGEIRTAQLAHMPMAALTATLRALQAQVTTNVERQASFAILQLNTQIIEETARGAGASHYKWLTEQDNRVRPHHAALEGTIQSWDEPPMGGGSHADNVGHPGSGYGCRCLPVPIQGQIPLRRPSAS